MVAKIVSGKSIRGILVYNEDKVKLGQAKLLLASGFGTDIERLNFHQRLYRFQQLNQLNARSKTNAMHISLNFHADDQLDAGKLQEIALLYMERLGLSEQPFIVYRHFDASHPHLHIATVLIDRTGKRISTQGMGKELSEPARMEIELKFGLVEAKGRRLQHEPYLRIAEYAAKPTKGQLANITKAVMRDYAYTSFAEYKAVLAQFNVHAERGEQDSVMFEKKGLRYSIMDNRGVCVGVPFKASSFYDGATMQNLEKHFVRNVEKRKNKKEELTRKIGGVIGRFSGITKATFQKELAAAQVAVVFRQNSSGLIYGLTFIDHKSRTVFNGSDLGKGYSAKSIVAQFGEKDVPKLYLKSDFDLVVTKELQAHQSHSIENLMDGLLEKADFDPLAKLTKKKRKKKGKDQSQNLNT